MFNFKALLEAWRSEGLIAEMYGEFEQMLDLSAEIFETARKVLAGEVSPESVAEEVRGRDKQINRLQRLIRRQVVEHLAMHAGADVTACLILMSIVKDAERLGDYGRDLFSVSYICPGATRTEGFTDRVSRLENRVAELMGDSRKALAESDEELARDVMGRESGMKAECDAIIEALVEAGLPTERTIALTLVSHYLRRLTAHTANIASGVINPVERLDYKPKGGGA